MQSGGQINSTLTSRPVNWLLLLVGFAAFLGVALGGFLLLREVDLPLWAVLFIALIWSIGSSVLLFVLAQRFTDLLPPKMARAITPFLLVGPVVLLLSWALVFPFVRTLIDSFFISGASVNNSGLVLLDNYVKIFTTADGWLVLRNNALWIIVGTPISLTFGMIVAVLADGRRAERWVKTIIFMPLAISLVGAGVIWALVYQFQPAGSTQIGLLNAIVVGFGGEPQGFLQLAPWNNLFLMVIAAWSGTGFAMVFFSAALRGVPRELIEAAEVDGAGPARIFFQIQLPYIWPTILAVGSISIIGGLKIFDVIQTLTGGGFETEVAATAFFRAEYESLDSGLAAAFAVVLLILVTPVMYYNLRQFRASEGVTPGGQSLLSRAWVRLTGRRATS